jgi:hypothetical protein
MERVIVAIHVRLLKSTDERLHQQPSSIALWHRIPWRSQRAEQEENSHRAIDQCWVYTVGQSTKSPSLHLPPESESYSLLAGVFAFPSWTTKVVTLTNSQDKNSCQPFKSNSNRV